MSVLLQHTVLAPGCHVPFSSILSLYRFHVFCSCLPCYGSLFVVMVTN